MADDAARIVQLEAEQAATAEVLRVIASSPTNLEHVLEVIAASTVRLCGAASVVIRLIEGDHLRRVALAGSAPPRGIRLGELVPIGPGTVVGRSIVRRATIHIPDVQADLDEPLDEYSTSMEGARLAVPLLREGMPFGAILLLKHAAGPFTHRQVALLETFADQAVIAIENARLFQELADLNRTLEARVGRQVDELERVGRLRRYLSPQLADLIISSGDESILESHRRQITVVFCDLRGFTAFAETAEPEEVMGVLAEYFEALGALVRASDGTLDHFAGDGMMVFFNDPLPQPDHAERAVRLACAMRERAAELARGWRRAGHELGFGVGVAVGYATLGRIGFEGRYDYTAIGSVANLAARLCGEAQSGQILIPARLFGMVEDVIDAEPVGALALKGFHRTVEALNVTGLGNKHIAED